MEYDSSLGLNVVSFNLTNSAWEDEARDRYLQQVFNPSRRAISKVLNAYGRELRCLSQDLYDDQLLAAFERYVDSVEAALRLGSNAFTYNSWPSSLDAAVHMMRYAIAQAADGLEEIRRFCQNYDYDHLCMAENLFAIAQDLSKQSAQLTKT
jgi:molecular chaperone DnaJ